MKAFCECGEQFYSEFSRCVCPVCDRVIELICEPVDFCEYRGVLDEALERIKQSVIKHGDWSGYSSDEVFEAIAGEFDEYREAYVAENISGRHGQVDELMDLVVTAVKGIRRLPCLQS